MKKVIMFLTSGFEEIEAVTVIDILRRANIICGLCSVDNTEYITGSHDITIKADFNLNDFENIEDIAGSYDGLVLPGGMPGSKNLQDNETIIKILKLFNNSRKIVSAICAAPIALERAGLLKNKRVTFYPGSIENQSELIYTEEDAEQDCNIITGKSAGAAAGFAFKLVEALADRETADKHKKLMLYG